MNAWYEIENISEIDSPQLVVYIDRVQHNINEAIRMCGVNRLRPHIKTNKTAEVVRMMVDAGIRKFKCATIEEAELLAMENADDVLLAYQPVGPKIERLGALIAKYPSTRFSCITDHAVAASAIANHFSSMEKFVDVFIDLNVGMNRTGIAVEKAKDLADTIRQLPGIRLRGLHAYDGHIRNSDFEERKAICDQNFQRVEKLVREMESGGERLLVIAGGSPTFPVHAQRANVECSPGTFVFWDKGYSEICPEQNFLPAAIVLSRVISLPEDNRICIDMGHKSIAAENEISRRAWFINEPEAKLLSQSEEHGVVDPSRRHIPGDIMYIMPYHVCPTVNLYQSVVVVKDNRAVGIWKVAARH